MQPTGTNKELNRASAGNVLVLFGYVSSVKELDNSLA
jgi:hypothetical protein